MRDDVKFEMYTSTNAEPSRRAVVMAYHSITGQYMAMKFGSDATNATNKMDAWLDAEEARIASYRNNGSSSTESGEATGRGAQFVGKKWMTNGTESLRVSPEEMANYKAQGWREGRGPRNPVTQALATVAAAPVPSSTWMHNGAGKRVRVPMDKISDFKSQGFMEGRG